MNEPEWVEVWINWDLRYLLLLRLIDSRYEVIDPQTTDPQTRRPQLPTVFSTYQEATNWLSS